MNSDMVCKHFLLTQVLIKVVWFRKYSDSRPFWAQNRCFYGIFNIRNVYLFSLKYKDTYNGPKYGLETLLTDICPYKSGLISKIEPFFMIMTLFEPKTVAFTGVLTSETFICLVWSTKTLSMDPIMVYKHFLPTYALIKVV